MKYAHIDINNKILGWYDKDFHDNIPEQNIEISDEAWQSALTMGHNKINVDGSTEFYDFRTAEDLAKERITQIDIRLTEIDVETVRPLRAINNQTATQFDTDKLTALEAEAETLRIERMSLVTW